MRVMIREVVGVNCVTAEDGEKVYGLIHPELEWGRPVELDFTGVRVIVSLFLNAAVGRLLEDIKTDDLNRLCSLAES